MIGEGGNADVAIKLDVSRSSADALRLQTRHATVFSAPRGRLPGPAGTRPRSGTCWRCSRVITGTFGCALNSAMSSSSTGSTSVWRHVGWANASTSERSRCLKSDSYEPAILDPCSERTHVATVRVSWTPGKRSRRAPKAVNLLKPGGNLVPTGGH